MVRNTRERGGIVVYGTNLVKNLFAIDQENHYFLLYRFPSDLGRLGKFANVTEVVLRAPNKLWWDQVTVPRFAARKKLDLIFNPKLSIPILTQSHTVWVMHGGAQFAVPEMFRRLDRIYFTVANRIYARKADAIITMTELGARDIANLMGADPRKIHAIHESYNERCRVMSAAETEPIKRKYNLPNDFILFVGGISPLKNFARLLRAFQKIRAEFPCKLVTVGFRRWRYAADLKTIDELQLQEEVIFPGFVEDEELPAFYNLAKALVFPSVYEGFGIPALEAMACGCPVIASNRGCSREVTGDAALLIDPYSVDDIANAIRNVLSDEALKRVLIKRGLRRCRSFSWGEMCTGNAGRLSACPRHPADHLSPRRQSLAHSSSCGIIGPWKASEIPAFSNFRSRVITTEKDDLVGSSRR